MSMRQTVFLGSLGWVAAISLLHGIMNLGMLDRPSGRPARAGRLTVSRRLHSGNLPPDVSRHELHQ